MCPLPFNYQSTPVMQKRKQHKRVWHAQPNSLTVYMCRSGLFPALQYSASLKTCQRVVCLQQLLTALFLTQIQNLQTAHHNDHGKLLCHMSETHCRHFHIAMRRFDLQTTVHRHSADHASRASLITVKHAICSTRMAAWCTIVLSSITQTMYIVLIQQSWQSQDATSLKMTFQFTASRSLDISYILYPIAYIHKLKATKTCEHCRQVYPVAVPISHSAFIPFKCVNNNCVCVAIAISLRNT